MDEGDLYPVPEGLDPALAVCLGVSGLAAWIGLSWRGRLAEGENVLVLGASGVVGQIAVQAAKLLGAGRVVAAARDAEALERAGTLGADELVRLEGDFGAALKDASDGGYDLVLDPLWGKPVAAAIAAMKSFGRVVSLGQSAGAEATLSLCGDPVTPIDLLGYTNYTAGEERKREAYAELAAHAAAGGSGSRSSGSGWTTCPRCGSGRGRPRTRSWSSSRSRAAARTSMPAVEVRAAAYSTRRTFTVATVVAHSHAPVSGRAPHAPRSTRAVNVTRPPRFNRLILRAPPSNTTGSGTANASSASAGGHGSASRGTLPTVKRKSSSTEKRVRTRGRVVAQPLRSTRARGGSNVSSSLVIVWNGGAPRSP